MTANDNIWFLGLQLRVEGFRILTGFSGDVGYQYLFLLNLKYIEFRCFLSNDMVINITKYRTRGLELAQLIQYLDIADIAGVPNFIHLFEVVQDFRVKPTVRVREYANTGHGTKISEKVMVFQPGEVGQSSLYGQVITRTLN